VEFAKEQARFEAERQWLGNAAGGGIRPGALAFGGGNDAAATVGVTAAARAEGGGAAGGASEQLADSAAPVPPAAPQAFSGTNVQEQGVDEPDLVKTDGRRLIVLRSHRLDVLDVTGGKPVAKGSLTLPARNGEPSEMLLAGDRLVILGNGYGSGSRQERGWAGQEATVFVVDLSKPTPEVVEEMQLEGQYVDARLIDGVARIVVRSFPAHHPDIRSLDDTSADDWLPNYRVDGETHRLVDCDEVSHPAQPSSLDVVTVITLDPADPKRGPTAAVLGAGDTVYASASSLYVATQPRFQAAADGRLLIGETHVHRFDIGDREKAAYVASGRVPGRVLNQFSLSEHEGRLRVATTDDSKRESAVTILEQDGNELVQTGSVGGLGRNEQIYAVRFIGDLGYVVTFRQTDPLYVVDLSDPEKPEVKGELKIPGYSAYLHPAGDGRLIGIGQDATLEGRTTGTQISLFDVSDPTKPTRLQQATIPFTNSEVEQDHHAFLWWPSVDLAVVPVQGGFSQTTSGAVAFQVRPDAIREVGRITHPSGDFVRRSLVIGDAVYTVSHSGVMANDLRTLAQRAWVSLLP
jgi:uncharacterized secreted protein with C-terminal beta-propeller domain